MRGVIFFFGVLILSFVLKSCNSVEPPSGLNINLELEDVSCTEAWITLSSNLKLPAAIELKQNDQVVKTINLNKSDSLLYVDSLLPNTSYQYQASSIEYPVSSNELNITTLDTTSHNFTWQTWTFGEHSSSVLRDVAIIDENNILAVGEIYMNDTLGQQDPIAYNAIHWDGTQWQIKRIYFPTVCGSTNLTPYSARSIFTFSDGQIWISSSGDKIAILQNGNQINQFCLPSDVSMSINKIWGSSSSDLYVVGSAGSIAHYAGNAWTKIESGTDVNLTDIYGTPDGSEVWACGWNNSDGHTVLLRIINNQSEIIFDSINPNSLPYDGFISSLWTNGQLYFWLTGVSDGAVKHSILNRNIAQKENFELQYFPYRIRGSELNDISMSGDAAVVWHYNGYSWRQYDELLNLDDRIRSIDMKDGIIVVVGLHFDSILAEGLIIIGRR
jgi:hypothetical protein